MASTSSPGAQDTLTQCIDELKLLLWGSDIKHDVFKRWKQGFVFSEDERTGLVQHEGGPCAVIAPVQAFVIKNLLFNDSISKDNWRNIPDDVRDNVMIQALEDMFELVQPSDEVYSVLYYQDPPEEPQIIEEVQEDGKSSPKKQCFSHEQFHRNLRCRKCNSKEELHKQFKLERHIFQSDHGVLLLLYSLIITKGIEQLKNEVEDLSEPLIDGIYGHGSQSLINLLLTGKAVTNVWDNDKNISGLTLRGIQSRSCIGFLTRLEHLRLCEVGMFMKNPVYPIWVLGSETHVTVLFTEDKTVVCDESPEAVARRMFSNYDTEGSGFVSADILGDLLGALDLVSEPEYVKIMQEKMDPEQLGIITLNSFMEEFFASSSNGEKVHKFKIYHYNGLKRSCPNNKVMYLEGEAEVMEFPEMQIITDSSQIKTCLMTKWPTIELKWKDELIPSLN